MVHTFKRTVEKTILIMVMGLMLFPTAAANGQEAGRIMTAKEKTNIRAARFTDAKITGQLQAGEAVKAAFLRNDWYAIFAPDEPNLFEAGARGYVYASRLVAAAAATASQHAEHRTGGTARNTQSATVSQQETAVEVMNITAKKEPSGNERVFIDLSRAASWELFGIEGKEPRIVMDIKDVSSVRQGLTRVPVQGKLIRQIRSNLDHASRRLRIVVDLFPSLHYEVEPTFYSAEKTYVLDIRQAPAGPNR